MKWRSLEESGPEADIRPLREISAERRELIAKYVPAKTQAIHARTVADLKQQHLAANILPIGARIPEFQLQDHDGKTVSSSDLLAKGRLVLCFIRGRWCPFCVAQMEAMNLTLPEMEKAGAGLVAISPQTVQQSFFMRDQHKLRFPLFSDASFDKICPTKIIGFTTKRNARHLRLVFSIIVCIFITTNQT